MLCLLNNECLFAAYEETLHGALKIKDFVSFSRRMAAAVCRRAPQVVAEVAAALQAPPPRQEGTSLSQKELLHSGRAAAVWGGLWARRSEADVGRAIDFAKRLFLETFDEVAPPSEGRDEAPRRLDEKKGGGPAPPPDEPSLKYSFNLRVALAGAGLLSSQIAVLEVGEGGRGGGIGR
jgi:hypothetical protein